MTSVTSAPSRISLEIQSQPACWLAGIGLLELVQDQLPPAGCRAAVIGCGTSFYVAQAFAGARELHGIGESDAFPASEVPANRMYDWIVAISRSGTTTEVIRVLQAFADEIATVVVTATANSPVAEVAANTILLDFADEQSIVQTRFATTTLALLRSHIGHRMETAIKQAHSALRMALPPDLETFDHYVFLGTGWTVGIAHEAALKVCEVAGIASEAFPAMEYRHGPISKAGANTLVWCLGDVPARLVSDIRSTGATVIASGMDAMADLVLVQRVAVAAALARGRNPDRPPHLTRSVILD